MQIIQDIEDALANNEDEFTISKAFSDALKVYKKELPGFFKEIQGKDFLVKHTKFTDKILTLMYKTVLRKYFGNYLPMRNSIPITLVALGSYGREQLAPYSDIDLMVVYEEVPGFNTQEIIETFLRIAWDAKLDLGHRVHEVKDLLVVSRDDITIKTALLESRFIAGSTFTWNSTQREIKLIRKDEPIAYMQAKLDETQERYKKFPLSMQPQIKEGAGGLRDGHLLNWIAYVQYGVYDIKDLTGVVFSEEVYKQYRSAIEFLYRVRTALHLSVGKKQDVIALESIPELIKMLNQDNQRSFIGKTLHAMHTINLFSKIYTTKMTRLAIHSIGFAKLHESRVGKDLFLVDQTLYASFKDHGQHIEEVLGIFATLPDQKLLFDPSVHYLLTTIPIPDKLSSNLSKLFYKLFERANFTPFLDLFYDAGVLGKLFPPLQKVHFLAQFDGYHQYPVTIHSIKCVQSLENIEDKKIARLYSSFSKQEQTFLKLVVLIHDAGKGRIQDHHEVGAKLFHAYADRIGMDEDLVQIGITLIKHHTYMSNIAFREDIYNEKVLFKFASVIGTKKSLDLLFVLTYADINGVGPDTYTTFNSRLLHNLYTNSLDVLDQKDRLSEAAKRLKKEKVLQKNLVFKGLPKLRQKKILSIVSNLFFIKHTTNEILALSSKAADIKDYRYYISNDDILRIEIYRKVPLNISYLLSKLNFMSVVTMDIFTLYNDLKYFRIDFSGNVLEEDIPLIQQIIDHSFDMDKKVKLPDVTIHKEDITLDHEHSKSYASMQIHTQDQKGLLLYIMTIFEEQGLAIATAKIHTIKKKVRDQFLIEKDDNYLENAQRIIKALAKES